jgi:uncharacterized membrane protein (UPF0127 family)
MAFVAGCNDVPEKPITTSPASDPPATTARQIPLSQYDKAVISVKGIKIDAYVADEQGERAEGLMFVKSGELGDNEGMIFVFPTAAPLSFWMENTLIPLDIAYLDEKGKILNVRQMQPLDRSPQPSAGAAMYAVETNVGWFEKNKVKVGDKFDLTKVLE